MNERCLKTYKYDKTSTLYLVPWRDDWHQPTYCHSNYQTFLFISCRSIEFRVFCFHGKTTAISQYNWMKDVGIGNLINGNEDILRGACNDIIRFCECDIIPQLSNETQGTKEVEGLVLTLCRQLDD